MGLIWDAGASGLGSHVARGNQTNAGVMWIKQSIGGIPVLEIIRAVKVFWILILHGSD